MASGRSGVHRVPEVDAELGPAASRPRPRDGPSPSCGLPTRAVGLEQRGQTVTSRPPSADGTGRTILTRSLGAGRPRGPAGRRGRRSARRPVAGRGVEQADAPVRRGGSTAMSGPAATIRGPAAGRRAPCPPPAPGPPGCDDRGPAAARPRAGGRGPGLRVSTSKNRTVVRSSARAASAGRPASSARPSRPLPDSSGISRRSSTSRIARKATASSRSLARSAGLGRQRGGLA